MADHLTQPEGHLDSASHSRGGAGLRGVGPSRSLQHPWDKRSHDPDSQSPCIVKGSLSLSIISVDPLSLSFLNNSSARTTAGRRVQPLTRASTCFRVASTIPVRTRNKSRLRGPPDNPISVAAYITNPLPPSPLPICSKRSPHSPLKACCAKLSTQRPPSETPGRLTRIPSPAAQKRVLRDTLQALPSRHLSHSGRHSFRPGYPKSEHLLFTPKKCKTANELRLVISNVQAATAAHRH